MSFSADPVRASSILAPGTVAVVGPNNTDYFDAMIDGATSPAATLQAGQSITWTFPRYVSVQAAASANVSAGTWQLEVPNQIGGWTLVENASGLQSGADARISRTYRLRNIGTAAITVGEYNIDAALRAGAPSTSAYGSDGNGGLQLGGYSGAAVSYQLSYVANDPYRGGGLTYVATSLPAGVTVSSTGLVSVAGGNTYTSYTSFKLTVTNALGLSTSAVFSISDSRNLVVRQYAGYRAWADGTYASSCNAYRNPTGGYTYSGATGDGVYRIKAAGATFDVTCDMTTDGGGWTFALNLRSGSIAQVYDATVSQAVVATQLRFLNKQPYPYATGNGAVANTIYGAICKLPYVGSGATLYTSLSSFGWGYLPNVTTDASATSLGAFPPIGQCRWKVTDGGSGYNLYGYEDTSALLSMDPNATTSEVDYAIGIGQIETTPNVNGENTDIWVR